MLNVWVNTKLIINFQLAGREFQDQHWVEASGIFTHEGVEDNAQLLFYVDARKDAQNFMSLYLDDVRLVRWEEDWHPKSG